MRSKLLQSQPGKTWALVFEKDEEVIGPLREFVIEERVTSASLSAIGAFKRVTLGFFDQAERDYRRIPIDEQVEVLSLVGNVATLEDEPRLHVHAVVGKSDGTAHGGHLLEGQVWPTLEVVLVESPAEMKRRIDRETGLPLLAIDEV